MKQSDGMGDRDTCLSLRGLVGFLSSENGCSLTPNLTPWLPLSPSLCWFLSHFLSSSLSLSFLLCPVWLLFFLALSPWTTSVKHFFVSPAKSDPSAFIWLYSCFILHVLLFFMSPFYSPSAFHLISNRRAGNAGGYDHDGIRWGDTVFQLDSWDILFLTDWCMWTVYDCVCLCAIQLSFLRVFMWVHSCMRVKN